MYGGERRGAFHAVSGDAKIPGLPRLPRMS